MAARRRRRRWASMAATARLPLSPPVPAVELRARSLHRPRSRDLLADGEPGSAPTASRPRLCQWRRRRAGRPSAAAARVSHGQRRPLDARYLQPAVGVYAVKSGTGAAPLLGWYPAVANLGRRPTVRWHVRSSSRSTFRFRRDRLRRRFLRLARSSPSAETADAASQARRAIAELKARARLCVPAPPAPRGPAPPRALEIALPSK